jgi:hypothetical protein
MPTLDKLASREGERLEVLTISQDLNGREKIEAFFARQAIAVSRPGSTRKWR